jgi:hypothetical protein
LNPVLILDTGLEAELTQMQTETGQAPSALIECIAERSVRQRIGT